MGEHWQSRMGTWHLSLPKVVWWQQELEQAGGVTSMMENKS